ncbi:MAG: putative holin-like toxin [Clostridiales bacterium]|nr:putative holin-like toxin [Clostridiales bacterium]
MTTFETLSILLAFGMFVIEYLTYKRKK